ncbi:MAG: type II secretion system protein [PVC group bacterium]|nr:type II secretion system protein [PVC group bacterium]
MRQKYISPFTIHDSLNTKQGFTLIELIVAVSILTIGLVMVLRSLIFVVSALDIGTNDVKAVQILEGRISELQLERKADPEASLEAIHEEIMLNNRPAILTTEVTVLEYEELEELVVESEEFGEEDEEEEEEEKYLVSEVKLKLTWHQEGKERDLTIGTYFLVPPEEEL